MTAQTADPGNLFDFITTKQFRASLESDYREMTSSLDQGNWKAAHVLAGSIIEAILADCLIALMHKHSHNEEAVLKMDMAGLVSESKKLGILTAKTEPLCTVVRNYRNLIHPGRVLRLKESIDREQAQIACSLVNMIAKEVEASKAIVYGRTAEQVIEKMKNDLATFPSLVDRHLMDLNPTERERLLLEVYPSRVQEFGGNGDLEKAARLCFRKVFDSAPDELNRKSVKLYLGLLYEGSGLERAVYERVCFEASDIQFAPTGEDQAAIKRHLIATYSWNYVECTVILKGIGRHLDSWDITQEYLATLLRGIITSNGSKEVIKVMTPFLAGEVRNMHAHVRDEFHKQLKLFAREFPSFDNRLDAHLALQGLAEQLRAIT